MVSPPPHHSSVEAAATLYRRVGRTLLTASAIRRKVRALGRRISRDYAAAGEVTLVANLKGSFRFLADLCSAIAIPVRVDFMSVSGYRGETRLSAPLEVRQDLTLDIEGRDVLLVEDIIDTGATLASVLQYLRDFKRPRSVRVCVLLDKTEARTVKVRIDYRGFVVPDRFLVGYGLDYREYFRELDRVAEFSPPVPVVEGAVP